MWSNNWTLLLSIRDDDVILYNENGIIQFIFCEQLMELNVIWVEQSFSLCALCRKLSVILWKSGTNRVFSSPSSSYLSFVSICPAIAPSPLFYLTPLYFLSFCASHILFSPSSSTLQPKKKYWEQRASIMHVNRKNVLFFNEKSTTNQIRCES